MKLRNLGNSDLKISPIGLGCWQFSKQANFAGKYWPHLDDEVIKEITRISLEGGINWFDTAEMYGQGQSERILARSLSELGVKTGEVIIATKWWPMFRTAGNIIKTIGDRIDSLNPFPIDLYMVHQPFSFSSVEKEMEAMARLVEENKIRYVGVSNFSVSQMRKAWEYLKKKDIELVANQVSYSLLDRRIEANGVMKAAKELGITIISYSPLMQGLLTGKFHDNPGLIKGTGFRRYNSKFRTGGLEKSRPVIELLKNLATKYGSTPSQISLSWLINFHGETVVAIPGATKPEHAKDNIGAMKFMLSSEEMNLLDTMSSRFKT